MATNKHWTQTPEGKVKMARAQKKAWRSRKSTSKAERIVTKAVAKKKGLKAVPRTLHYERIAKMAVAANEVPALMKVISYAVFMNQYLRGGL